MLVTLLYFLRGRFARRRALAIVAFAALAAPAWSGPVAAVSGMFSEKLDTINTAIRSGRWDGYVSGYAWHLPWGYSAATRARLNETTWGGGIGRSVKDADGDRHSVFFMAFVDSHRDTQFIASYGWQRYRSLTQDVSLGWGYMAFLFSRKDVANYTPFPAVLPCASIRYRRWEAVGLFVPRVSKDIKGDVFYVFMRVGL
jgi:palmitoyl transferase